MSRPSSPPGRHRSIGAIFAFPLAIALAILAGLVIALTGDGWRDAAAWAALALPICAFAWAFARRH